MSPELLLVLGISHVILGVLCIALAIPLLRGKIPMNRWYGVRFKKSFSSPENWRRLNAYGARAIILGSIPILLIAIGAIGAALAAPQSVARGPFWPAAVSLSGLFLVGAFLQTWAWSTRLPPVESPRKR